MAIRAWFLDGLRSGKWDPRTDKPVPAPDLAALLEFPDDYHMFILTIYQTHILEAELLKYPQLKIHYQQKEPSVSYRYPSEGPKLLTYILKVVA